VVQSCKDQDETWTSIVLDELLEISNPKSIINQRKDITRGIESRFVC
jgi:hypothetical protein